MRVYENRAASEYLRDLKRLIRSLEDIDSRMIPDSDENVILMTVFEVEGALRSLSEHGV